MTQELADRHCKPCEGGVEPLQPDQAAALLKGLHAEWVLSENGLGLSDNDFICAAKIDLLASGADAG